MCSFKFSPCVLVEVVEFIHVEEKHVLGYAGWCSNARGYSVLQQIKCNL